jgi:hypothetical protein
MTDSACANSFTAFSSVSGAGAVEVAVPVVVVVLEVLVVLAVLPVPEEVAFGSLAATDEVTEAAGVDDPVAVVVAA